MNLVMSSFELIAVASILSPQQADAQRALAKLHSKKRWVLFLPLSCREYRTGQLNIDVSIKIILKKYLQF